MESTSHLSFLKQANPQMYGELSSIIDSGDFAQAHRSYFDLCRHVKKKVNLASFEFQLPSPLTIKGFAKIKNALKPELIQQAREILDQSLVEQQGKAFPIEGLSEEFKAMAEESLVFHKCATPHSQSLVQMQDIIKSSLVSEIVEIVEGTLKTNFYVNHFMLSRTFPTPQPVGSFAWHRDAAPFSQVHVMFYLTDSGENGEYGATELLPVGATRWIEKETGYNFVEIKARVNELSDLTKDQNILNQIERPSMNAGDALVFAAPQVLHRGIPPQTGYRDALLLVLQPSILPWDQMLERTGVSYMASRVLGHLNLMINPADP